MDKKHFAILKFLFEQNRPITEDDFPNSITSEFSQPSIRPGGLLYELEIILEHQKDWVHVTNTLPQEYSITENGKNIIAPYLSNKSNRIIEYLKPYGGNNFVNINPILESLFPLATDAELHEFEQKGIELRDLINGMVKDGLIKLNSLDINKLGTGHSGQRDWFHNIKVMASYVDKPSTSITKTYIEKMEHYETSGNNSPIAGRNLAQRINPPAKESTKEAWWKSAVKDIAANIGKVIGTAIISFIAGVGTGKSCNPGSIPKDTQQEKSAKKPDSLQKTRT